MVDFEITRTVRDMVREATAEYQDIAMFRTYEKGCFHDISYIEFCEHCEAVGRWIASISEVIGHKPRIAMSSPNSAAYATLIIGTMYGGGIAIPLDVQMNEKSICGCLNKAEADLFILEDSIAGDMENIRKNCPKLREVMTMSAQQSLVEECAKDTELLDVDEKECAIIVFTSGTTGEEKGVMLSNLNIVDATCNIKHDRDHVKVSFLPLHHVFGLNGDITMNFTTGATTCFNSDLASLEEKLRLFNPTFFNTVPRVAEIFYNKIRQIAAQRGCTEKEVKAEVFGNRIRIVLTGGAPLPAELVAKYRDLDILLCQGYGMTECTLSIASADVSRPGKDHAVGRVVLRCQTRVVDGELQVKSPSVMMGYVNEPELTAEMITEDGWLRTGDIGYVDEDGFAYITGRQKNLIILGNGENVSPEQIEKLLLDHQLVEECLVYGEGNSIVAEIFPSAAYAKINQIADIHEAIKNIVDEANAELPTYKEVRKYIVRAVPFRRTATNKIIRDQRACPDEILQKTDVEMCMPANELQQKIYDCVASVLQHKDFGIHTDLFVAGIDSLGCVLLLVNLEEKLAFDITLEELVAARTVEKLEVLYQQKTCGEQRDYSPREEYPLTYVQMHFAYAMRGNTTGNVPVLFRLDESVDLDRLENAIRGLFQISPILNNRIVVTKKGYMNSRDDSRPVVISRYVMNEAEWQQKQTTLVRPFRLAAEEPLYRVELYCVDGNKYLFFDVAHIISDGTSISILLDNLNRLYAGENVKPETYSFYEYILDEKYRDEKGLLKANMDYFYRLMEGVKIQRSILNSRNPEELQKGKNAALRGTFEKIRKEKLQAYCHEHGISENVVFLTAFNYCISLFSDNQDTVSTSIHNGRIDSRWGKVFGCLFGTYSFRCTFDEEERIVKILKDNAGQIMQTMCCHLNCLHADEMFFQYQGELLDFARIAGAEATQIPMQLDSVSFHMIVMSVGDKYVYELRYWENRFEKEQLEVFLRTMEEVLLRMLEEETFAGVRQKLDTGLFPEEGKVSILDSKGRKQLIGAWGTLYDGEYDTGKIARILPDGSVDELKQSGRMVMQEGLAGRSYLDLEKLESILLAYPGIRKAQAYTAFGVQNNILLTAEIKTDGTVVKAELMKYLQKNCKRNLIPAQILGI